MADKNTILKLFNIHLFEFMDELVVLFPDNLDKARQHIPNDKTAQPVYSLKYGLTMLKTCLFILKTGDFDYFLNKDYKT